MGCDLAAIVRGNANSATDLLQTHHLRAIEDLQTRTLPRSQQAVSQAVGIYLATLFGAWWLCIRTVIPCGVPLDVVVLDEHDGGYPRGSTVSDSRSAHKRLCRRKRRAVKRRGWRV